MFRRPSESRGPARVPPRAATRGALPGALREALREVCQEALRPALRAAALVFVVGSAVAVGACDSSPKPGEEGAYWGRKLIEEKDFGKRDVALKKLLEVKDKGSLPFLHDELKQPVSELRPQVVELIGLIGDATSLDPLVDVIDLSAGAARDKSTRLKANANEKAVKALTRLAADNPAFTTNPKLIETVRKLAGSDSLDVQLAAIFALGELKAKDAVDELIKIADGHPNNFMVKNACEALTKIGDPKAAEVMGRLMFFERDGASFYRESSLGLFVLGKDALPTLQQIWDNKFAPIESMHIDPLVQKTKTVVVYGDLADPSTFDRIVEAATTEGSTTGPALLRVEGQRAAGRIGIDKVSAGLKKQIDNVDVSQSEHALAALVQLGHREIAGDVWKMTTADGYMKNCTGQDNSEEQCKLNETQVRKVRLLHWSRIADGAALANLDKAIAAEQNAKVKDEMTKVRPRLEAAQACAGKGVPCWQEKLKDATAAARERAAYELLWVNTDESRDALVEALTDKDNETRYAAITGVLRRLPKDGAALADKVKAQLAAEKGQAQFIRINEDLKRLEVRLRRGY
jgi:HEAT repeat protein